MTIAYRYCLNSRYAFCKTNSKKETAENPKKSKQKGKPKTFNRVGIIKV